MKVYVGMPSSGSSFASLNLHFPNVCACCGEKADTHLMVAHTRESPTFGGKKFTTFSTQVPYCSDCKLHFPWKGQAKHMAIALSVVGFLSFFLVVPFIVVATNEQFPQGHIAGGVVGGFVASVMGF